jgi:hypothetical protein
VTATGRYGLAELPAAELGREVVAGWDAFLQVVQHPSTDLSRPSRLTGWSGRDTCIHLGSWDDSRVLDSVLASARAGQLADSPAPDAGNEALVRAHRGAATPRSSRRWCGPGTGSPSGSRATTRR